MSFPRVFVTKRDISNVRPSGDVIGEGNFCSVQAVTDIHSGLDGALKVFPKHDVRRLHKEKDVLMEKHALSRLDHPRIVKLLFTFKDSDNCYIVTDLCRGGELWGLCEKSGLGEGRAKMYMTQILSAVAYMHRIGIVHRDIKAENIFLSADQRNVKVGDLGSARDLYNPVVKGAGNSSVSRLYNKVIHSLEHYVGTPNFMAPEAIVNEENDELSDIWSLGCLIYQIIIGIPPFVAGSEYLVFLRVRATDLQFPPRGISSECVDLIRSILQPVRLKRPSIGDIMTNKFFQDVPVSPPPMSEVDLRLQSIARDLTVSITDDYINEFPDLMHGDLYRIKTVREWFTRSQPGSGTDMLSHLDLSPGLLGTSNDPEFSSDND